MGFQVASGPCLCLVLCESRLGGSGLDSGSSNCTQGARKSAVRTRRGSRRTNTAPSQTSSVGQPCAPRPPNSCICTPPWAWEARKRPSLSKSSPLTRRRMVTRASTKTCQALLNCPASRLHDHLNMITHRRRSRGDRRGDREKEGWTSAPPSRDQPAGRYSSSSDKHNGKTCGTMRFQSNPPQNHLGIMRTWGRTREGRR